MLSHYKEEPMRTILEIMMDTGYLGVKRNFSSRSQRRDAEELNVCGVVYGYIVSTDSHLFTESNLKQLLQTASCRFPQAGSRELQYHGEFTCFCLLCSRESWPYSGYCSPSAHYVNHVLAKVFSPYVIYFLWFHKGSNHQNTYLKNRRKFDYLTVFLLLILNFLWSGNCLFPLYSSRPQHIKAKCSFSKCLTKRTNDKYQAGVLKDQFGVAVNNPL